MHYSKPALQSSDQLKNRITRVSIFRDAVVLTAVFLLAGQSVQSVSGQAPDAKQPPKVEKASFGKVQVVWKCGDIWMASQPSPADLDAMASQGIYCVVTLRTDEEVEWDEKGTAKQLGLDFHEIPVSSVESLTDEVFAKARKLMREHDEMDKPIFVHCGAAVRVAAVWAAYRVLDQGVGLETALLEAEAVGLRSPKMKARVTEYIQSQK